MLNTETDKTNDIPNLIGSNMYNSTGVVFVEITGFWLQTQQLRAVHYSILNLQSLDTDKNVVNFIFTVRRRASHVKITEKHWR